MIVARKFVNNLVRDSSYCDFREDYGKIAVEGILEETLVTRKKCVAFLRAYHMFLRRKKLRISRNVAVGNLCKLSSYRENLIRKTK